MPTVEWHNFLIAFVSLGVALAIGVVIGLYYDSPDPKTTTTRKIVTGAFVGAGLSAILAAVIIVGVGVSPVYPV